ncbi:hypothetical protein T10_11778 [Trichinella papuae]|uniref:Uncharacterized protein n=1 Tax=Trichinella papuae TaxID=268474 RepID=A0A0V1M346_9BILA|nr:hypothetical protein T10_11778 [Trichinella papuae]
MGFRAHFFIQYILFLFPSFPLNSQSNHVILQWIRLIENFLKFIDCSLSCFAKSRENRLLTSVLQSVLQSLIENIPVRVEYVGFKFGTLPKMIHGESANIKYWFKTFCIPECFSTLGNPNSNQEARSTLLNIIYNYKIGNFKVETM